MAETKSVKDTDKKELPVFTKEQIVKAARFSRHIDIIDALLRDGERYTMEQVEERINKFLKGEVK